MSTLSVTDPVDAALERWSDYSWTHALLQVDEDRTRAEFRQRTASPRHEGGLTGTLFSVKDLYAVAGVPSAAGSLVLADHVPARDATVVARLRAAGATFFGKGNCAEFGFGIDTDTRLGGRVLHPDDPGLSPGGSSGGDAVAVATRAVDFAVAGDYGGSVRWPAQAVGIYGLRTGVGALPRTGRIPGAGPTQTDPEGLAPGTWSLQGRLEVVGLMARTPALLRRVFAATTGPDGADWSGLSGAALRRHGGPRRVLVCPAPELGPVLPVVSEALGRTARDLAALDGVEVDADRDGLFRDAFDVYRTLRAGLDGNTDVRRLVAGHEDLLCPETVRVLDASRDAGPMTDDLYTAWLAAERIRRRVRHELTGYDAVLMPLAPTPAVGFGATVTVGDHRVGGHDLMAHCRAVSLTGLPALSVPVHGLPGAPRVSVQLVGRPGGEDEVCALAQRLDEAGASAGGAR